MDEPRYALLTDSTCDLTLEFLRGIGVGVIPLSYTVNNVTRLDSQCDADQSGMGAMHDFYQALREGAHGTTSQITIQQCMEKIGPYLENGDVMYLAFSSGLSGSYQSACSAAMELREKYPNRTLYVIDTKAASLGEGLLVTHAAQKRKEGMDIHTLKKWVDDNWQSYCHLVTVDNLHHLRAGGRISATTEVIGSIFDIKPMIHVDLDGHLIASGKVRGRKRALRRLVEQVKEDIIDPASQVMYICQGDCIAEAEFVKAALIKEVGVKDVMIGYAGPVIGSHTGPGVIAVFFKGKGRK
ncbi:MAG: DegV family protein [Oscillospiraceae bacterium]|jgi:DegV family protein with EDD domain|nr:DegV family protein [Oscillospiraceae bacterium]